MTTIYKYKLNGFATETEIQLPAGSLVLKVDIQDSEPTLWALVDTESEPQKRVFEIFGTGQEIPNGKRVFINTFFVKDGLYVFHVFEKNIYAK